MPGRDPIERNPSRSVLARVSTPRDPLTSLVLTLPAFVVYHVGILTMDLRNGADLVSSLLVRLLRVSLTGYLALTVGLAVVLALTVFALRRKNVLHWRSLGPVLFESTAWAVAMWLLVGWATLHLVPGALAVANQIGPRTLGPLERIVMAAGAGFHEELIFRAGLFGALAKLFGGFARSPGVRATLLAALVSSVLFSAVHYVGALGDAFTLSSFVFRALSGLYLCVVYRLRGFAVAVYTHALYDVGVFFLA